MAFTEDLTQFFDLDDFAVEAEWSEAPGEPVNVIFDKAFIENLGIAGNSPVALGKESDFPDVAEGQTLTISGTVYTIITSQPDGTGVTTLIMEKA
jgi:hypothetical protein